MLIEASTGPSSDLFIKPVLIMANGRDPEGERAPRFEVVGDTMVPVQSFALGSSAQTTPDSGKTGAGEAGEGQVNPGTLVAAQPTIVNQPIDISPAPESLPVVPGEEELSEGALFEDRNSSNKCWHIPAYQLSKPASKKLFLCRVERTVTDDEGNLHDIYHGHLRVGFSTEEVVPEQEWAKLDTSRSEAEVRPVPVDLQEVALRFSYHDPDQNRKVTEEMVGSVDMDSGEVQFDLMDDYLKIIYQNVGGRSGSGSGSSASRAELVFRGQFEGWRDPQDLPQQWVLSNVAIAEAFQLHTGYMEAISHDLQVDSHEESSSGSGSGADDPSESGSSGSESTSGGASSATGISSAVPLTTVNRMSPPIVSGSTSSQGSSSQEETGSTSGGEDDGSSNRSGGSEDSKLTRQKFSVEQVVPLSFACEQYRSQYAVTENGEELTFGCSPPWSRVVGPGYRYRPLDLDGIDEGSVYESRAEPDTFVVVPSAYVIARDRENQFPAVSVLEGVNPERPEESLVRFQFAVEPEISPYQWRLLEQRLLRKTSQTNGSPAKPRIFLPHELPGTKLSVEWKDQLEAEVTHSQGGDGLEFILLFKTLKNAALATEMLKGKRASLLGSLQFQLTESMSDSSSLVFDLNRTSGTVLSADIKDRNAVTISNNCESPTVVRRLLFYKQGKPGHEVVDLPTDSKIKPDSSRRFDGVVPVPDGGFDSVAVDREIEELSAKLLSEKMVELDLLQTDLAVTTNLDPEARNISELSIEVKFPAVNQREVCTLKPSDGSFANSSAILRFSRPLNDYLSAEERIVKFRATICYNNDRSDFISDWIRYDTGRSNMLNVTAGEIDLDN